MPMRTLIAAALATSVASAGCGDDDDNQVADGAPGAVDAAGADAGGGCPRRPPAPDRTRRIVLSHPYDVSGGQASQWEVLDLAMDGAITQQGVTFAMGRATIGEVAFTPDGLVGLAAQEDGSLGVFRFDDGAAAPAIVHAAFTGAFYAERVVMAPGGARAWVIDPNTPENGGGVYAVAIDCDGSLTNEGLVVGARSPGALLLLGGGARAVLAARDVLGGAAGDDAHLLTWGAAPAWLGGADAFADDEAIVSAGAATADGKWVLVGDNSGFSGIPNRVAILEVVGDGLRAAQVLSPIEDPMAIVTSPYGNAAIVVSGFGDAVFALDVAASGAAPFSIRGELTYTGARPQLPAGAVRVAAGILADRVFVAENLGVRQVEFSPDGTVMDLGLSSVGSGLQAVTGAIGVQP